MLLHSSLNNSLRKQLPKCIIRAMRAIFDLSMGSDDSFESFGCEANWFLFRLFTESKDTSVRIAAQNYSSQMMSRAKQILSDFDRQVHPSTHAHSMIEACAVDDNLALSILQLFHGLPISKLHTALGTTPSHQSVEQTMDAVIVSAIYLETCKTLGIRPNATILTQQLINDLIVNQYRPKRLFPRYSENMVYLLTHGYYFVSRYGRILVPESVIHRELSSLFKWHCNGRLKFGDWDSQSELLECFVRSDLDRNGYYYNSFVPHFAKYCERAIDEQMNDGSWWVEESELCGDQPEEIAYSIYHVALTIIDVIKEIEQLPFNDDTALIPQLSRSWHKTEE